MSSTRLKLTVETQPHPDDDAVVRDGLASFNAVYLGEKVHHVSVFLRDENNQTVGGALVYVHSDSIFIDTLWVQESRRNQGYGAKLLIAAETEGRARSCRYSTLDTFDFQAEGLYRKHGYERIGVIDDCLLGHPRIFMRKTL